MRVIIASPRIVTGGPENLHQLCDRLNRIGVEAAMYYHPNPEQNYEPLYPQFAHLPVARDLPDAEDCVVVVPEIIEIRECHFSRATVAVWWLSYINAALIEPPTLKCNIDDAGRAVHLFHSYHEYAMVRPFLPPGTRWFFLTDHIDDEFLALDPASFLDGKRDLVCFNKGKDLISEGVCRDLGLDYVPIADMSRREVMETLAAAKVYLDNGYHPGKDRLPREAAMHGCVVITNKSGAAAYFEDVPIEEKVTLEHDLYDLIPRVFNDFRHYYDKQQPYRDNIRLEKRAFEINVENFWAQISGADD